jgi:hypothetical protein
MRTKSAEVRFYVVSNCRAVLRRELKIVDFDNVMLIREYQFYCLSFVVLTPVKMSYGLVCDCKLSFVLKSVAIL